MNKYSFFYAITIALLVPTAYAMEDISSNSFTQLGKQYMQDRVEMWVATAQLIGITTGLASVFKDIQIVGIDALINDQKTIKSANMTYREMVNKNCVEAFSFLSYPLDERIKMLNMNRVKTSSEIAEQASNLKALLIIMGHLVKTEDLYNQLV